MKPKSALIHGVGAFALAYTLAGTLAPPAGAMSLIRAGLNDLVTANSTIVVARVEDATSYWNADATFILTDYRLSTTQVLKGEAEEEITLTLMGGTAGDFTTLVPGVAQLLPDRSYLLFLRNETLPGTEPVLTVGEHCQGAFDLETRDDGTWAVSQAAGAALVPGEDDSDESADVPGGANGMSLADLAQAISALVKQGGDK